MKELAKGVMAALIFFTRIPFWRIYTPPKEYFRRVVNYWPVAGVVTGTLCALVLWLLLAIFPPQVAAVVAVAARMLATGALHEDGLADFFDGFGGGKDREHILAIMKDSHIGSYGVLALTAYFVLLVLVLSSFPATIAVPLILFADIFSKFLAANVVALLPYARNEQQSKNRLVYEKIPVKATVLNLIFVALAGLYIYMCVIPGYLILAAIAPVVLFAFLTIYINRKIGGYTGDCCGALFLLCELSFLIATLAILQ